MKYYWIIFSRGSVLLHREADGSYTLPYQENAPVSVPAGSKIIDVVTANQLTVKTYSVDEVPQNFDAVPLRQSYYKLSRAAYIAAGKCAELIHFDHTTRYCGACGAPMEWHTGISKRCTECGKELWPQLAPAVIVLIHRGPDEILMARAHNFRGTFYGLIAGFVETGETLEQAVEREVKEETGLTIRNLKYFASQPWPYPAGIMVGFHADYADGELHIQHEELRTAGWFHRDHLPELPEKLSIARRLIDSWLEGKHPK